MAKDLTDTLIAPAFVRGMLSRIGASGADVTAYLQRVGADTAVLTDPAHPGISSHQYVALFYTLAQELKDESVGLFSRPFKLGSFALVARSGMGAPELGSALQRMSKVLNLLQDDLLFSLSVQKDEAGLDVAWVGKGESAPAFLQETMVRVLWRLAAWLINGPLPIRHFDFMFPEPDYARDYAAVFPGERRFQQATSGFWFDAAVLQTPVSRDEQALRAFLPDAFAQILLPPRGFGPVSQEVRNCLLRQYPDWPDLPAIAASLHVSPATLQRQLAHEDSSLQKLKDDLRRGIAIARLTTSRIGLAQLATELGFSDSATFQRAFKKWTGKTCGEYRATSSAAGR
ncbi:AraC family transcriptional regulator [Pseudoduganella sp. RAF53_2]|uniref:AraC family transcriptional regulator n=1 Tax=unclassified Pseudoduganella TaxID=2637179 RepID=UPI003F9BAB80